MSTEKIKKPKALKRLCLTLTILCSVMSYPAYTQVSTWTNQALDKWASQRVGMTVAQADEFTQIANAMPDYLKAPLPGVKP